MLRFFISRSRSVLAATAKPLFPRSILAETLERRQCLSGTLLSYDFANAAATWPNAATASGGSNATVTVDKGGYGTIDVEGGTTLSGAIRLNATPAASGSWSGTLSSGNLAVSGAAAKNLMTFAFSLKASTTRPVNVQIESHDTATGPATGTLQSTVIPAAAYTYQRCAIDLNTMNQIGGTFDAAAPYVTFKFVVGSATGWGNAAASLYVDNINYAKPQYYVDATHTSGTRDGLSEATAFTNPRDAVRLARPGDIIVLKNGTYAQETANTGAINFDANGTARGGTPANWVVVKNYPGQSPLITNSAWNAVRIGADAASSAPALAYIEIRGLQIRGNASSFTSTSPGVGGDGPLTNGNGISVSGDKTANRPHDIRIADNIVENNCGGGIGVGEADRVLIENNVSRNNCFWTQYATSGISVLGAYNFEGTTGGTNRIVRNNRTYGNQCFEKWFRTQDYSDGNGIIVDLNRNTATFPSGVYRSRTLVANNLSYANGGGGIHTYQADNIDIINNTTYLNSASPYLEYAPINVAGTGYNVSNNIMIASTATGGNPAEPVSAVGSSGATSVLRNNLYYGGNTAPFVSGSDHVLSTAEYNGLFVGAGTTATADFHLTSGAYAIKFGTPTGLFTDLDRQWRTGNPDAGAYEFV